MATYEVDTGSCLNNYVPSTGKENRLTRSFSTRQPGQKDKSKKSKSLLKNFFGKFGKKDKGKRDGKNVLEHSDEEIEEGDEKDKKTKVNADVDALPSYLQNIYQSMIEFKEFKKSCRDVAAVSKNEEIKEQIEDFKKNFDVVLFNPLFASKDFGGLQKTDFGHEPDFDEFLNKVGKNNLENGGSGKDEDGRRTSEATASTDQKMSNKQKRKSFFAF